MSMENSRQLKHIDWWSRGKIFAPRADEPGSSPELTVSIFCS
jgi:hypothetical protein